MLLAEHEEEEELALTPSTSRPATTPLGPGGVRVLGVGGLVTTFGRCCNPLPGDDIVGYITRARGVTVHRADCRSADWGGDAARVVECDWGPTGDLYTAGVEVLAWDRVGLLRDLSTIIAGDDVNMVAVRTLEHDDRTTMVELTLETTGGAQFARVLSHPTACGA